MAVETDNPLQAARQYLAESQRTILPSPVVCAVPHESFCASASGGLASSETGSYAVAALRLCSHLTEGQPDPAWGLLYTRPKAAFHLPYLVAGKSFFVQAKLILKQDRSTSNWKNPMLLSPAKCDHKRQTLL